MTKDKEGKMKPLYLRKAVETSIRRHKKIIAKATPFEPKFKEYFKQRVKERKACIYNPSVGETAGLKYIQPY